MNNTSERRNYKRVHFEAEIILSRAGSSWVCNLVDISLKGMLALYPEDMAIELGAEYQLELTLGQETAIKENVTIVHHDDGVIGLEWKDIDLDSLTHLRRLLEFNMSDPAEMHRELSELG